MKRLFFLLLPIFILLFSSCELVGDIFKAGMGFGIFLVIAVIILILYVVMRVTRGGKK
jgi:hypothetical protein